MYVSGTIERTCTSRSVPPDVSASAVARSSAGRAVSTSRMSTGTRMVLNMGGSLRCGAQSRSGALTRIKARRRTRGRSALAGGRADHQAVELRPHADLARQAGIWAGVRGEVEHVLLHRLRLAR